jgi:hypothetical protein
MFLDLSGLQKAINALASAKQSCEQNADNPTVKN